MSLNHPFREGLGIDFSAILPAQIKADFQRQVNGLHVEIVEGTPRGVLRLELKDGDELRWKKEVTLEGGVQVLDFKLPSLGRINQLVWVLDRASPGDFVTLKKISLSATNPITDPATAGFVWSYAMLLNNWNPASGLVRDKAKDASGEMDAIQASGALAAATVVAEQLGVIEHADAVGIVGTIGDALLNRLPRNHGLWPHWVKVSNAGEFLILENTEWSSVDSVIAALGLLEAQSGLGLDTAATQQMLREIDWEGLVTGGGISHGFTDAGKLIPYSWDTFGGESWLVELAYAAATGRAVPVTYPAPPTANGSGFIDELAWLFLPPPSGQDIWGTDWQAYRQEAVEKQITYYVTGTPGACLAQLGLFGLSAGEVPDPSSVKKEAIYQAFGAGGQFAVANDSAGPEGAPVALPHYAAMAASLRPQAALQMWDWLIQNGHFSPLTNTESLTFTDNSRCEADGMTWNQLKGSWNLALQALGWGRYLAEKRGLTPILWQAARANGWLQKGYVLLATPGVELASSTTLIPTPEVAPPEPTAVPAQESNVEMPDLPAEMSLNIIQGPELKFPRSWHTATTLLDGRVLLVGGSRSPHEFMREVEIFDPAIGSTQLVASLHTARHEHTAKLLLDGRVLVVGGYNASQGWLTDAEVYDPAADTWRVVPPLYPHGVQHTATLLQDGRVLVVGGCIGSGVCTQAVEIFDPQTDSWREARFLDSYRGSHTATLLGDGRVLVAGGAGPDLYPAGGDALLYDPRMDTWTATGAMVKPRLYAQSVLLADGRALVAGGMPLADMEELKMTNSVEIFDPATNGWTAAASLSQARYFHNLVLLQDGQVLVAGGVRDYDDRWTVDSFVREIEIYDPVADRWRVAGELTQPRILATVNLLADGSAWLAGGQIEESFYSNSWLMTPTFAVPSLTPIVWQYQRECEFPNEATTGQALPRANASGLTVHGQFGTTAGSPWPGMRGYVRFTNITVPKDMELTMTLRYSKYSAASVPISITLDDETDPRASFYPADQGDWDSFAWTEVISLGRVTGGVHSLKFATEGQQYGVADLDQFVLEGNAAQEYTPPIPTEMAVPENDLLVWYDFEGDFTNSGVVVDLSGNRLDGQVTGGVSMVEGVGGGQAAYFSEGMILAQSNPAAGKREITFSLWFKTDHPENNYKLASAAWWNWGPGSGWIMATHLPEFWSDDTLGIYLPEITINENNFLVGAWNQEVVTYDGQRIKEYTNGKLVNDFQTTGAAIGSGQPMVVGGWPPYTAYNFQGSLDEFQIFSTALTEDEVQALYGEGIRSRK